MISLSYKNVIFQLHRKNNLSTEINTFVKYIATSSDVKKSEILTKNQIEEHKKIDLQETFKLRKKARTLSTLNSSVPLAVNTTAVSKEESRKFMAIFPDLVRDLTEKAKKYGADDSAKWLARALQYNVPLGKKNRGLAVILAYKALAPKNELTPENVRLVHYLGWCVEMMQSSFLVADDIMDDSETRRGQKCWHRLNDVNLGAVNDGMMIQSCIFYILKKYFENKPYYVNLVETFNDAIFTTIVGQSMDLRTANKNVTNFTMERYKTIVAHKTAYYTFYTPVALAMHMAGFTDSEVFRQTKTILLEMGHFFQVHDDFIDCFGDPKTTGKIGTDIENNKCSWLAVVCMQRANNEQKEIMKECYGKNDPEKVMQVKKLYEELGIPHTYQLYEEESYNLIKTHIQQTSRGVSHDIFIKILDKIYRGRVYKN